MTKRAGQDLLESSNEIRKNAWLLLWKISGDLAVCHQRTAEYGSGSTGPSGTIPAPTSATTVSLLPREGGTNRSCDAS